MNAEDRNVAEVTDSSGDVGALVEHLTLDSNFAVEQENGGTNMFEEVDRMFYGRWLACFFMRKIL